METCQKGNIQKDEVHKELSRICKSKEFSSKPLMVKFLTYLVQEYLKGRGDRLKGYTIAIELLEQGEHFDPDQNTLVRIYAGRLRRSLKIYYLEEGQDDPIIIEIPKGRYCPTVIKRDTKLKDIRTSQVSDIETSENSIAVLPFKNLSRSEELDYLAFGFAHELSDVLTKYYELKVVGINKKPDSSVSEEALMNQIKANGVKFLVLGELAGIGSKIKISFRLIHVPENEKVWASSCVFNKDEDAMFEIQEKVSKDIAGNLGGAYGRVNKKRFEILLASKPASLNEQELLLKHYHAQTILTPESVKESYELAYDLIGKEPNSVLANALVASVNSTVYSQDLPGAEQAYVTMGELSEKAYNLNPNHKLAFTTLASKSFYYGERDRLNRLFEEGQKWLPNTPMGIGLFGMWFSLFGEWEFGKELIDNLYEDNVFIPSWYSGVRCLNHYRNGDYKNACLEASRFQLPGTFMGPMYRIPPLAQLGRIEEAKKEWKNLLKLRPDFKRRGRYLHKIHIREDTLVDHLIEGFDKIGVIID
ncbi:hypothetical protein LCM02_10390 [Lutimonas saemankumensis]|uniref:hypothetical protein n=1 Tax=Lutimonas saemankumensis TaxID=483016 RepID=UPI001CD40C85|nr:hypothetical protein [Lutimonas saemankumensis]MCA0932859.1 hypothetical protein [Lutimonas saemankumensis]